MMIAMFGRSLCGRGFGSLFGLKASSLALSRAYATEETFDIKTRQGYKTFKLEETPPTVSKITKSQALNIYRDMFTIRRFEASANLMYKEKLIRGFLHLCNGQEAIPVGIKQVITPKDSIITAYRCHGFAYIMGIPPSAILTELTGGAAGCSHGKGGSMHLYKADSNFFGGNGIVGAQVPLGTGLAFAKKYLNDSSVSIALYGDGAANQGQVFEAFNFAKLNMLPIIYICENNLYGMGTSSMRSSANAEYYTRGDYIPGLWVDGMDVLAVKEAVGFARKWCIDNKGPILLEMATYRYMGHSMSDPGTSYRTREEINLFKQEQDPINTFKSRLINAGIVNAEEIETIENEVKAVITDAEKTARTAAKPDISQLVTDVYSTKVHNLEINSPNPNISLNMSL